MSLAQAQTIFAPAFLAQLHSIKINGNFGDIVMNRAAIDIITYFRTHGQPELTIEISTNGGARDAAFWTALAKLNTTVYFCLDGLADTHSKIGRAHV